MRKSTRSQCKCTVLFIVGLDLLEKYKIVVNNVHEILDCYSLGCQIPLTRKKSGHIYLEWDESQKMSCTYAEPINLHRKFSHPSSDKLFNLLKLARQWVAKQETKNILQATFCHCDFCQNFAKVPVRFRVSLLTEKIMCLAMNFQLISCFLKAMRYFILLLHRLGSRQPRF